MPATPAAQHAPQNDDAFVIFVKKLSGAMAFICPQAELDVQLSRADVASLEYFQDPALRMGGRMKVTLVGGSTLWLHCFLENAQDWSTALLPEERDHEFMLQTREGERRCAWGDDF